MSRNYVIAQLVLGLVALICGLVVIFRDQAAVLPGLMLVLFGSLLSIRSFYRYRKERSGPSNPD